LSAVFDNHGYLFAEGCIIDHTISAGDSPPGTSVRIQCSFCSLSDCAKYVAVTSINWYKNIERVY